MDNLLDSALWNLTPALGTPTHVLGIKVKQGAGVI